MLKLSQGATLVAATTTDWLPNPRPESSVKASLGDPAGGLAHRVSQEVRAGGLDALPDLPRRREARVRTVDLAHREREVELLGRTLDRPRAPRGL
jgi:hypothetical protein